MKNEQKGMLALLQELRSALAWETHCASPQEAWQQAQERQEVQSIERSGGPGMPPSFVMVSRQSFKEPGCEQGEEVDVSENALGPEARQQLAALLDAISEEAKDSKAVVPITSSRWGKPVQRVRPRSVSEKEMRSGSTGWPHEESFTSTRPKVEMDTSSSPLGLPAMMQPSYPQLELYTPCWVRGDREVALAVASMDSVERASVVLAEDNELSVTMSLESDEEGKGLLRLKWKSSYEEPGGWRFLVFLEEGAAPSFEEQLGGELEGDVVLASSVLGFDPLHLPFRYAFSS